MPTPANKKMTGQNQRVTINSDTFCSKMWTLNRTVDTIDMTDSCSGGWAEPRTTFKRGEGSIESFLDADNVPAIEEGDLVDIVLETSTVTGSPKYSFQAYITGIEISDDVAGPVTFNVTFVTTGPVTEGTVA